MDWDTGAIGHAEKMVLKVAVEELIAKALRARALSDGNASRPSDTPIGLDENEGVLWHSKLQDNRFLNALGLCHRCQYIETGGEVTLSHHRRLQDLSYLKHVSLLGCGLCRHLFREMFGGRSGAGDISVRAKLGTANENVAIYEFLGQKLHFEIHIKENTTNMTSNGTMRELLPDPLADSTFSIAQNWLETCLITHNSCFQGTNFLLPSRIIDVTGEDPCLRTLNSTGVPYTILSHCWGGVSTVTTTKSNLEDHMQRIEFYKMPKTFQDAVKVTRKLNINYIWIDSLCILQDSLEDWETESTKMGDYYGNSQLVLSALNSHNCQQGFLNQREGEFSIKASATSKLFIRSATIPYHEIIRDAPLSQRGWALQERLLATRILHYGEDEMFWECLSCFGHERYTKTNHYPSYAQEDGYNNGDDLKLAIFSMNLDAYALYSGAYARWYQIITDFSRRTLTYDSDVLPALSGLAIRIQQKTGSTYIAGLWAEDVHGLVWCKDNPQRLVKHAGVLRKGRLENNCSWSWVSTRQSIRYLFKEEKRTESNNDAIIREHSDLCLALSVVAQPVQCAPSYEKKAPYINGFQRKDFSTWSRDRHDLDRDGFMLDIFNSSGSKIGIGCFDDADNELTLHQCHAIWIAERVFEDLGLVLGLKVPIVYFLLIVPVLPKAGVWKRVGMGVTRETWAVWPFVYFPTAFEGCVRKDVLLI